MAEAEATENQDQKRQIIDKIKSSDNILVALNNNPSVDELASALGLALLINKMGKHATAIFSGELPNALEFLEPDKTFEKSTDSLRDFIIALNKDKADHIRCKIDGDYAKVYITPYRTTISESDLEFSMGDFNVDLVIALNVRAMSDLDAALSAHGRILHDATVVDITTNSANQLGSISWCSDEISSLSEMIVTLSTSLRDDRDKTSLVDKPIATALLTGIVSATERFSNDKTTPNSMVIASKLMTYGADQQLVAQNLQKPGNASAPSALEPSEEQPHTSDDDEFPSAPDIDNPDDNPTTQDDPNSDRSSITIDHGELSEDIISSKPNTGGKSFGYDIDTMNDALQDERSADAAKLAEQKLAESSSPPTDPNQPPEEVPSSNLPDDSDSLPPDAVPPIPADIASDSNQPAPFDFATTTSDAPAYSPPEPHITNGAVSDDSWQSDTSNSNIGAGITITPPSTMSPPSVDTSALDDSSSDSSQLPDFFNNAPSSDPTPVSPSDPSSASATSGPIPFSLEQPASPLPMPPDFNNSGLTMPPEVPNFDTLPPVDPQLTPQTSDGSTNIFTNNYPVMTDQVYPAPQVPEEDPAQFKIPGM